MAKQSRELQCDDDAADTTHKARYHGVGHQSDVLPKTQYTKCNLDHPGEDYGGEHQRDISTQRGKHAGEDDNHRPGWPRDL